MPQTPPIEYFLSYFSDANIFGVFIALLFGAIWIACFKPPIFQRLWLWEILAGSAIITLIAVSFIQIPIQNAIGMDITELMVAHNVKRAVLLNGIPLAIVAGIVQEGAKLIPPVIYWLLQKRDVSTRLMIIIGAIAGAGFGIFEAQWIHNMYFAVGWNWAILQDQGLITLIPFVERFIIVAFHTGACALTCYGLAKGPGWLYYLIIALVHAVIEYGNYLILSNVLPFAVIEIYITVLSFLIIAVALWLRWKKQTAIEMHVKTSGA
jgi:RsiW-degrading membrane proteinase PrsW (M82 family)